MSENSKQDTVDRSRVENDSDRPVRTRREFLVAGAGVGS